MGLSPLTMVSGCLFPVSLFPHTSGLRWKLGLVTAGETELRCRLARQLGLQSTSAPPPRPPQRHCLCGDWHGRAVAALLSGY